MGRGQASRPHNVPEPEAILEHRLEESSSPKDEENEVEMASRMTESGATALEDEVKSKEDGDGEMEEERGGGKGGADGGRACAGAGGELRTLKHLESVSDSVRNSPGFKFLTRPDLYKFVKVHQRCGRSLEGGGDKGEGLSTADRFELVTMEM